MWLSVSIAALTCILMIASILFFPKLNIRGRSIDTYPIIVLVGAIAMLACGLTEAELSQIAKNLLEDS